MKRAGGRIIILATAMLIAVPAAATERGSPREIDGQRAAPTVSRAVLPEADVKRSRWKARVPIQRLRQWLAPAKVKVTASC
ncbi:hypothetical protein [Sphingomonas sp. ID0503]|uniref:hypothetical protein n=1 Tax=Sphingomonas sp. ID0503 TaxID=3399691 RepID=UPI003AFB3180